MTFTTAFFDLDGVLWDSEAVHLEAFQKAASDFRRNYPGLSDAISKTWVFGIETRQVFLNAFSEMRISISDSEIQHLVDKKRHYAKIVFDDKISSRINQKAVTFAKELKNCGYQIGLVSGSSKQNVDLFLHMSNCHSIFSLVLNSSDFKANKPAPEPYLLAMKTLRVTPDKCIAIEDSHSGITSAQLAGISEIIHYPQEMEDSQRISLYMKKVPYNHARD
jgi:HAD superfamily hydrolase (TIGR01549 family)